MMKKILLVTLFVCNTILPSQFFKRCFDKIRNIPIKTQHAIVTGIAGGITTGTIYNNNKDKHMIFDISDRDGEFEKAGYRSINDDPQAKPIIDAILKQYAPYESDIRVYEKKESRYDYWKLTGSPSVLSGAHANSLYKAIYFDNKYLSDAIRDRDDAYYPNIEATMGHEIGHIVHKSSQKGNLIDEYLVPSSIIFGTVAGYLNCLVRACHNTKLLQLMIPATGVFNFIAYNAGSIHELLSKAYSRHDERRADHHAIMHAKNPDVLQQQAFAFKEDEKNDTRSFLEKKLWSTHPSSAERAVYFEKAAQELEEKIAREN